MSIDPVKAPESKNGLFWKIRLMCNVKGIDLGLKL